MPPIASVENNFTKGLVTEFTGLNFPENAATDCDNVEFTLVGDVVRREGIDIETNAGLTGALDNVGTSSYVWTNAGGDGNTKLLVRASGNILRFYSISAATVSAPVSQQLLGSTVDISAFTAQGGSFDTTKECTFADGNGYLFVYHPSCDTSYCTYVAGTITANAITVQIRDFTGVPDNLSVNTRPTTLSAEHQYNLQNQGWIAGASYVATSSVHQTLAIGTFNFTVAAGISGITNGDAVSLTGILTFGSTLPAGSGNVTNYTGTTLTVSVTSVSNTGFFFAGFTIQPTNIGYISTWHSAVGGYPSNADVWWTFKNSSDVFDPGTTLANVTLGAGNAPRGHYVLSAFNQNRDSVSALTITDIVTTVRPKVGTWFQGRVWYAGIDSQQPATGDVSQYSWTENIYFSQIVQTVNDFGSCFQLNDPTSETLFDLLPTDGGIIQIQGCGSINKLFPIQNGMLVHATNGIWFITGSQGIGFSANDYTITKISNVQSISPTSFVNVNGLPYFWNEEGIYTVTPAQQGGLEVNPLTVGTILSFYNSIPKNSKQFARGDYHPIDYVVQWTYRSTQETDISDRYDFDSILNFNTYNKAFFPYSVATTANNSPFINGVNYISYPQIGATVPDPGFKYILSFLTPTYTISIGDEHDETYTDWATLGISNFDSFFVTGYKLHGQGQKRFQIPFIYMYSRSPIPTGYKIQGLWDYAISGDSGRWSVAQLTNIWSPNFAVTPRRHRIRGQGLVLQLKVSSIDGTPFDIIGWSVSETVNQGT